MSNESKLYWLTRLDAIIIPIEFILIVSFVALLIYTFLITVADDDDRMDMKKRFGKTATFLKWALAISFIITTFLPSKYEAILIVEGGKTLDFVQSDTSLSKIPEQTTAVISKYLDEQIKKASDK